MLINQQRAVDWSAARLLPATDYLKMQRLRAEICENASALFKTYAAVASPAVTSPASVVDFSNLLSPTGTFIGGGSLALGNLAGLPAVSVPCGFTPSSLPLGIQLIGPAFDEAGLLRIAHAYEQANAWHERHPRL